MMKNQHQQNSSNIDTMENFKINKKFLVPEPEPLWHQLSFGFRKRLDELLALGSVGYDDLFRLGG